MIITASAPARAAARPAIAMRAGSTYRAPATTRHRPAAPSTAASTAAACSESLSARASPVPPHMQTAWVPCRAKKSTVATIARRSSAPESVKCVTSDATIPSGRYIIRFLLVIPAARAFRALRGRCVDRFLPLQDAHDILDRLADLPVLRLDGVRGDVR